MSRNPNPVTYIGRTNHRNSDTLFGIKQLDRRSHMYICGKTGTGKSHLLRNLLLQDVAAGRGCALFDPHGDLVRDVMRMTPSDRSADVCYIDATDDACRWRFNPFLNIRPADRALACAGIVAALKNLWPDDWGPRLEHLLRNVAMTLLECDGCSFADIPGLLTDSSYRTSLVNTIENDVVRDFWHNEFTRYSPAFRSVIVAPLQNKVGALLTDPTLRRLLTQDGGQVDLPRLMDNGNVLLVNLDKGRIGEGPSALLGSLLLSGIGLSGLGRSTYVPEQRRDFFVYLDEFQTFTTLSIATMLSELRKYSVGLILSHQHLSQLASEIRDAVFGNVGTLVSFRVGARDADFIAKEFAPVFGPEDLLGLPKYSVYVRLLIDGETSRPFSATTVKDPIDSQRVEH